MNSKMISFDANFGDSFHKDTELFAMKMWQPINAVKFFTYDFRRNAVAEVYEIPLSGKNLDELQQVQLVRISDEINAYALLLDWNSYKEVYLVEFTVKEKRHKMHGEVPLEVSSSLIGKYDFICPNLYNSSYKSGQERHFVPNQQVKIVPLYKRSTIFGMKDFKRDGFSLLIDQVSMDFDYSYFSNVTGNEQVKLRLNNCSSVFEYETSVSRKIKKNIHEENAVDARFFEFLVIKTKIRQEILDAETFTETQKLKLLRYFSRTLQAHKDLRVTDIMGKLDEWHVESTSITFEDCVRLMQPRSELYGAN